MFNQYQNFIETLYFYQFPFASPFFNYQPLQNSIKVSSNFIVVENESRTSQTVSNQQKILEKNSKTKHMKRFQKEPKRIYLNNQKNISEMQDESCTKKIKKIKKTQRRQTINQKQGRNSHSNILRKFFKLLFVRTQIQQIVQKIITKFDLDIESQTFFLQIRKKCIDHRNYIRIKEVQWLFNESVEPLNKLARILFKWYLQNYYVGHLLSSKKTSVGSVAFHLEGRRNICEEIMRANGLFMP